MIEELRNSDHHIEKVSSLILAWLRTFKLNVFLKFTCILSVPSYTDPSYLSVLGFLAKRSWPVSP